MAEKIVCGTRFSDEFGRLPVIHSMGLTIFDPIWSQNSHIDNRGEILHIVKGTVNLEIGDTHTLAGTGETLIVPSGVRHRDVFNADLGLEVFVIFFNWEDESEYLSQFSGGINKAIRSQSVSQKNELSKLFDSMRHDMISGNEDCDIFLARARLMNILMLILKNHARNENDKQADSDLHTGRSRRRRLFLEAKEYLEHHYQEPISLDQIAESLQVSPFHLSRVFSMESDFSLFSYLTDLRMSKACELLEQGRLNVSEVAGKVGYENSGYFSKVFKRYCGKSPSEYGSNSDRM